MQAVIQREPPAEGYAFLAGYINPHRVYVSGFVGGPAAAPTTEYPSITKITSSRRNDLMYSDFRASGYLRLGGSRTLSRAVVRKDKWPAGERTSLGKEHVYGAYIRSHQGESG